MTPADVLAQSCHSFIGELWQVAIEEGFTKPLKDKKERLLWQYWDAAIPKPNCHTAPFWLYACEGAIDVVSQSAFSFVPPMCTPLQLETISDSGVDAFLHPIAPPREQSMRRHIGTQARQDMFAMIQHVDTYTPVATWAHKRISIATSYPLNDVAQDWPESDITWRKRMELGQHIATPIRLPTCSSRLKSVAGKHLENLNYYGLALRGDFEGAERDWADGEAVRINDALQMTSLPFATMPVWFGFRIKEGRPTRSLFDWCRAYAKNRDYAIECLRDPAAFEGYPSFTESLRLAGAIGVSPEKKKRGEDRRSISSRESQMAGMFAGTTFDLPEL